MIDHDGAVAPATTRWRYAAADAAGTVVRGEIDATSEREAVDALRRRMLWVTSLASVSRMSGTTPSNVKQSSDTGALGAPPGETRGGLRFSLRSRRTTSARDLAVVTRAMATLVAAGVPLERALGYASAQAPDERSRRSFTAVRDAVRNGQPFSAAVGADTLFPRWFAPTLAAGEASGTLDASLLLLADHLERSDAVRSRLRSALTYPAVLGIASIVGVVVIMLVVVPRFADLIADNGGTLPLSTRLLIGLSSALARSWWLLLIAGALAVLAWRRTMADPTQQQRWHAALLRWPVVGPLERTRGGAAYTGTLSVALQSGVGLLKAMQLARQVVSNRQLQQDLEGAEQRVRDGGGLSVALDGILPPLAVRLLDAGEIGGDLAMLASRAAQTADADVQRALTQAVTLVEPALILGFGGLVGFVALALLQAIYGINAGSL